MKRLLIATTTAAFFVAGSVGLAAAAGAMPADNGSAADTVARLQSEGYHVQLNGPAHNPLSLCDVTGISGMNGSNVDSSGNKVNREGFHTVYVDVACQEG